MRISLPLLPLCFLLLFTFSGVAAINSIEVQSQDFADSITGTRFEVLGVDYQPGGSEGYNPGSGVDPLSNGDTCLRDAALMQMLGVSYDEGKVTVCY